MRTLVVAAVIHEAKVPQALLVLLALCVRAHAHAFRDARIHAAGEFARLQEQGARESGLQ